MLLLKFKYVLYYSQGWKSSTYSLYIYYTCVTHTDLEDLPNFNKSFYFSLTFFVSFQPYLVKKFNFV